MNRKSRKQTGSISLVFVVTLILITMLFVLLTETLIEVGRANRTRWAQQACLTAAGVQLDSFQATGGPVDPNDFARLWPHMKVSVETEAGKDPWQGLTLVRVETERRINRRNIHIQQSRYIALPQEGQP